MPWCSLLLQYRRGDGSLADAIVAPLAGIEHRRAGHFTPGNMEAVAEELRAGSRVPVTIDQIVNDTLVVTLTYRERSYTGILLDCDKKTGLFCLPDFKAEIGECPISTPACEVPEVLSEELVSKSPSQASHRPKDENTLPESSIPTAPLPCPVPTPVLAGQTPYPPYFEGAPFPQPLWVRHSYSQWVPQPPPRPIKRKKRRTREPGRMTMSTIRLRPRQVLCEKCKNTLNSDEDSKDGMSNTKTSRKENALQSDDDADDKDTPSKLLRKEDVVTTKDTKRRENGPSLDSKRLRKDKRGESEGEKFPGGDVIPHSPVIKISYSTPQGKGEVMKIPARVHGSVKPFCPKQLVQNGVEENDKIPSDPTKEQRHILDATRSGLTVSIPKLKLTRPFTTVGQDLPSPKIHLRPPQMEGDESVVEYEAELVGGTRRRSPRVPGPCLPHSEDSGEGKNSLELWSGSSGEEADRGHSDLTLLINFRKRKADSSSLSVCSSDSLDESKSFSSDGTSPELCDLAPGEDLSVTSSSVPSREDCKTVPPLTVRLHTRSMTKCVTEEGHAVAVGDIVWGKIHGFPWWPARVLSISGTRKQETASCEAQWPQAKVAWFGSPTTSQLSVAKLSPFRELFRSRFNRKKKGMYRRAIQEAAKAVGHMSPEITSLLSHCDT
ncbi:PWWP domain-containing protein 2B isoform X2 [Cottoperca gobio]|nr:PWWP domain-containing protein 2B isoform X2 [Cottoperca gobio]